MRVLFTVSNWPGHYYAMVPLGWALQAAGHEVRVACAASETAPISRAGLVPVPVLSALPMTLQARLQNYMNARAGLWRHDSLPLHPETGRVLDSLDDFDLRAWLTGARDSIGRMGRESTDAVVTLARSWKPDLIVHDLLSLEGVLAAQLLGIPAALHLWGPTGTHEQEPGLDLTPVDYSKAFARHGLPGMSLDLVEHVIDPCPSPLAPPVRAHRIPVRFLPYNGTGAVPDLPAGTPGRPRVCLVWGTSVTTMYGPSTFVVPRVLEAAAALDAEVVLALTEADRARLPAVLPANVVAPGRVPLHVLLPGSDVVVHHGGAGCVMTSLAAGVPQLSLTNGLDQSVTGRRLEAAGTGLTLTTRQADVPALTDALGRLLLGEPFRSNATALAAEMRSAPSPADLVPELEKLAA